MQARFLYLLLFFFPLAIFSFNIDENEYLKIINAHMRIKDFQSANDSAIEALNLFPQSKDLWQIYIKVLSKQRNEKEMLSVWKNYIQAFPEEKNHRMLIETLAWGTIDNASCSSSPIIRVMAVLSAFLSQDAKGIEILRRSLQDPNSAIRGMAVQLSAQLGDADLQDEIYHLFQTETVWNVRLK